MAENLEVSEKLGIIPDFFHDILAYLIPGYTAIILFFANFVIIGIAPFFTLSTIGIKEVSISMVIAYVLGRFFEQLGYLTIHKWRLNFALWKAPRAPIKSLENPKWDLVYNMSEYSYTSEFKSNLQEKIAYWLRNQNGEKLLKQCINLKKDDYFNLIQFYLRARFPSVAIFEKKQNANIILCRSLSVIGGANILVYLTTLWLKCGRNIEPNWTASVFLACCLIFSSIMYLRFLQDRKYHAMYIFETFIATKKLLKSIPRNEDTAGIAAKSKSQKTSNQAAAKKSTQQK